MDIPEILNLYGSPEETAAVERLCLQAGRVTYHWNILNAAFRMIFALLLGARQGDRISLSPGIELWDARKTAHQQRAMLRICAQTKLKSDAEFRDALLWALDQADTLESYRHQTCRMVVSRAGETIKLNPVSAAASQLARIRPGEQVNLFRCLIYDLYLLDHYATRMIARMIVPWHWKNDPNLSLADKPALLTALLVEKIAPRE